MALIPNLHPKTVQKFNKMHDKFYCRARLKGHRTWNKNDTLEKLMDNYTF